MTPTNLPSIGGLSDQLKACHQKQFTGRLSVQAVNHQQWSLYFKLGRLVWANGGGHWFRRWRRLVNQHGSRISHLGASLKTLEVNQHQDYDLLMQGVKSQSLTGAESAHIVRATVAEVLFDMLQQEAVGALTFTADNQDLDIPLLLINPEQAASEAKRAWNTWNNAGLANVSPNLAPILRQPEQLKQQSSASVYESLVKAIDGDRTLRDLALLLNQELQLFTKMLKLYISKEWIGLVEVPDLLPVVQPAQPSPPASTEPSVEQARPGKKLLGSDALPKNWAVVAALCALVAGGGYIAWQLMAQKNPTSAGLTSRVPAGTKTLTVVGDAFSGHSTFRSAGFQEALKQVGINLKYQNASDQQGAALLNQGQADLELTSLDQFLRLQPQGKIVGLISRTVGADALVLNTKQYPELKSLADLSQLVQQARSQGRQLELALPESTPSEYLALLLSAKFDQFNLSDFQVKPVGDGAEGWKLLQDPNQKIAAAILREPELTQARNQGYTVALSSQDVPREIVDLIVASDRMLQDQPETVEKFLTAYYRQVDADVRDGSTLRDQIAKDGDLTPGDAKTAIAGIDFFTAPAAKAWLKNGQLAKQIDATAAVLTLSGKLDQVPPQSTALFTAQLIEPAANNTEQLIKLVRAANPKLADKLAGEPTPSVSAAGQMPAAANPAQKSKWEVKFKSSSTYVTDKGRQTLSQFAKQAAADFNQQKIAIRVIGHTSKTGPNEVNQALSQERAQMVADYLYQFGFKGKIIVEGKGSSQPLPGIPATDRRNQRAEIYLDRLD
ncbi:MAG: OmpA family protein [Aphanocapsa sp. GSE-SYN-MK-11-07L]|jgi:outer membrane protein OmpA-like peptidoglycan-associated protein|nr:OmpA family protein [Aphanocapsa sp. GSE-SYN-MK-11-07L]